MLTDRAMEEYTLANAATIVPTRMEGTGYSD